MIERNLYKGDSTLKNIASITVFAFIGGCCRYLFSQLWSSTGILIANLIGTFILAFLTYYVIKRHVFSSWLNTGIGTGMIGSFTTFSSFATITVQLAEQNIGQALGYLCLSAIGGLLMATLGYWLANKLVKREMHHD